MIDAVDIFETYATSKGWKFAYGAKEILNVEVTQTDLTDGDIILLLFPFVEDARFNDGIIRDWLVSTSIYLGRKFDSTSTSGTLSSLDETTKQKYDRRLLALRTEMRDMLKDLFCDGDYTLQSAKIQRELNIMSENLDFVVAQIAFTQYG